MHGPLYLGHVELDISDTVDLASDFAPYLNGRTIEETIVEDYVMGNVHAAAENQRDEEQHEEDEEQDLGDFTGEASDAAESEGRRNDRDDEEYEGVA